MNENLTLSKRYSTPAETQAEADARVAGQKVEVVFDYGTHFYNGHFTVIGVQQLLSGIAVRVDMGAGRTTVRHDANVFIPGGEFLLPLEEHCHTRRVLGPSIVPEERAWLLSLVRGEVMS